VPGRTVLQSELRRYAELRLRYGEARGDIGTLQLASARGRQSIEAASLAVAQPIAATPLALAIMNSADEIGDRGVEREVTMQARLPTAVFAVLLLFMCVAVGVMGYAYPVSARRRQWASALLFSLLIITLLLIIDLDRPAGGSIVIEQDAMKDLVTNFRSNNVRPFGCADSAVRGMEAQR
jgi:hypothetical protein